MKGDILIFNMRYCSLLFTKKLQRYGMINRPSLDQPLYLDISRYLDIFHLDTGYLNISVSKYLFLLYCRAMSLNDLSRTAARGNTKECMQRVSNFPSPSVNICTQLTDRSPQHDIGPPTHSIIFFISFRSEDIGRQPRNRKTTAVEETWSPSN